MSDEDNVRPPRGKRSAILDESSSDSGSDHPVEASNKRKKMNVIESDSSSEDSDGSSVFRGRKSRLMKKRPKVSSDDESSSGESILESSGESSEESSSEESDDNVGARLRRRVTVENEEDSSFEDSESEETSSESGHSSRLSCDNTDDEAMIQAAIQESLASAKASESKEKTQPKKNDQVIPQSTGFDSDSSDGQSEKCPICLVSFTNQEIGSPETCDHVFCCMCIEEWSKNVNTCPVDRQEFSLILVRKEINGKVVRKIPIRTPETGEAQESDSDPTFCEVCGESDREDRLLLCDGCDLGYHLECLDPPLENVPVEEWFCPECTADHSSRLAEEIDVQEGELFDLLDDMVQVRPRTQRLLPRTRQSERVRANLRTIRLRQRTVEPALQVLYDNDNLDVGYSYWSDSD